MVTLEPTCTLYRIRSQLVIALTEQLQLYSYGRCDAMGYPHGMEMTPLNPQIIPNLPVRARDMHAGGFHAHQFMPASNFMGDPMDFHLPQNAAPVWDAARHAWCNPTSQQPIG